MSTKKLTDCPSNLKEAIDWILRVTGKDGQDSGIGDDGGTAGLANAVTVLLEGVKSSSLELNTKLEAIMEALKAGSPNGLIDNLATGLAKFIGYETRHGSSGQLGTDGIGQRPKDNSGYGDANQGKPYYSLGKYNSARQSHQVSAGYYLTYNPEGEGGKWDSSFNGNGNATTCARIFLSVIPLMWFALSYLYFMCRDGGTWNTLNLNESALSEFILSMWFGPSRLQRGQNGEHVASKALGKFTEFQEAKSETSYADFVKKVRDEGLKAWTTSQTSQSHFLSGLYFLSLA
ncbi:variant erythrocyte surface antigen-1 family protein [Babesia caballi]|uniref:Variant erythrocyte surface antigen-1 family protein n=1 Tax=Babesia caballi TaxID=5871 RepID=A0AAV4LNX7_BABCB|nr:variant erythrocyte surface antigen-1 family protein [Babesia caballi]